MDKFVAEILHMAGHGNCDESCDSYWNAWAIDFVNRIRADERANAITQLERLLANENFWEHDEIRPGLVAALAVIKGEWKFDVSGEQP